MPEQDPSGLVYQKRAGTGAATFFESRHDPMAEAQKVNAAIAAEKAQKQKGRAAKKAAARKSQAEFDFSIKAGLEQDWTGIDARKQALFAASSDMLQKGIDFTDMAGGGGAGWRKQWDQLSRDAERSALHEGYYTKMKDAYDKAPEEYDPSFIEAIDEWANKPLSERGSPPEAQEYWNELAFTTKLIDKFAPASSSTRVGLAYDQDFISKKTVTGVAKEKLKEVAAEGLVMEPKWAASIAREWAGMSDEEKLTAQEDAVLEGFEDVNEFMAYDRIKTAEWEKVTKTLSAISGRAGYGASVDKEQAEYFLRDFSGYATGTSPAYKTFDDISETWGVDAEKIPADLKQRFKVDVQPHPMMLNVAKDKRKVESLGAVIFDANKQEVAFISEKERDRMAKAINSGNESQVRSIFKQWETKEFSKPEAAFSKDAVEMIHASKELKQGHIDRMMKKWGIMGRRGEVDVEKVAGGLGTIEKPPEQRGNVERIQQMRGALD